MAPENSDRAFFIEGHEVHACVRLRFDRLFAYLGGIPQLLTSLRQVRRGSAQHSCDEDFFSRADLTNMHSDA